VLLSSALLQETVANNLVGTSSSNIYKLQHVENCLTIEWYFKPIQIQIPPFYHNSTGFQSSSKLRSKLQHSRTSQGRFWSTHLSLFGINTSSRNLSGPSAHLIRICCLCHAATAVSGKEVFPTAPLKSGMTYHFRPDSPLQSIA